MWNPKNAVWGCTPETSELSDKLSNLDNFPSVGEVSNKKKNPSLEKFRKAQNVVYDIFNNGLGNRGRELRVLGLKKHELALEEWCRYSGRTIRESNWDQINEIVEVAFTPIVMDASREQGLIS
jgi:hypothetical protein